MGLHGNQVRNVWTQTGPKHCQSTTYQAPCKIQIPPHTLHLRTMAPQSMQCHVHPCHRQFWCQVHWPSQCTTPCTSPSWPIHSLHRLDWVPILWTHHQVDLPLKAHQHFNARLRWRSHPQMQTSAACTLQRRPSHMESTHVRGSRPIRTRTSHDGCTLCNQNHPNPKIIGTLLYYSLAINPKMLVALGTIAAEQRKATENTAEAVVKLLKYAATHPNATICYHTSNMILYTHSAASYLSVLKARSRAGSHFPIRLCTSTLFWGTVVPYHKAIVSCHTMCCT